MECVIECVTGCLLCVKSLPWCLKFSLHSVAFYDVFYDADCDLEQQQRGKKCVAKAPNCVHQARIDFVTHRFMWCLLNACVFIEFSQNKYFMGSEYV